MTTSLTIACIKKILNGENVPNPVFQILSNRIVTARTLVRYQMFISDGLYAFSDVVGKIQTADIKDAKEIEDLTVIRVDQYYCHVDQITQRKVIMLDKFTILAPGNEAHLKIDGANSPRLITLTAEFPDYLAETFHTSFKYLSCLDLNSAEECRTESETGTISAMEMVNFLNLERYTMVPSLSSGFINKILNGEDVANPVFQVLELMKIPVAKKIRHRLRIFDGEDSSSFFILGTKLNHMVDKEELGKFDVIRVERYTCSQNQADRKVITLLKLTVMVPGSEINKVLSKSNAVSSPTVTSSEKETVHACDSTQP